MKCYTSDMNKQRWYTLLLDAPEQQTSNGADPEKLCVGGINRVHSILQAKSNPRLRFVRQSRNTS